MVDVQVCAIAKLNLWYGENGEFLLAIGKFTARVECCQVSAATETAAHAKFLGLADVEGVGSRVSDCEAGVVVLVVIDVVVGEVRDPDVDAVPVRAEY